MAGLRNGAIHGPMARWVIWVYGCHCHR